MHGRINRPFLLCILVGLVGVFLFSAGLADAQTLFSQAADSLAVDISASLKTNVCNNNLSAGMERQVAIWPIEQDQKSALRTRLKKAVIGSGCFKLFAAGGTDEALRILSEKKRQLRFVDQYDPEELVEIGRQIAPKSILVSRIESINSSDTRAEIDLAVQLLDLKNGRIAWVDIASAEAKMRLEAIDWIWRILLCLVVAALGVGFLFMINKQTITKAIWWLLPAGITFLTFWFLLGKYM